ncbi:hypothetical protein CDAR_218161 [Caerostris darwini]|uniref:Uncharacterized protein n=1 Tax=Caerostris darwini TaxID=1538125 RepID=A0AAV4W9Z4_9ARAC|nr:hypothetical protein CDAR_218161 [Caerostris darwini]
MNSIWGWGEGGRYSFHFLSRWKRDRISKMAFWLECPFLCLVGGDPLDKHCRFLFVSCWFHGMVCWKGSDAKDLFHFEFICEYPGNCEHISEAFRYLLNAPMHA